MTDLRTAAQQVLEALDGLSEDAVCQSSHHAKKDQHTSLDVCPVFLRLRAAITALKAALAEEALQRLTDVSQEIEAALEEPVQEPVAWMVYTEGGTSAYVTDNPNDLVGAYRALALYTAPPQRKPLTAEEIPALAEQVLKLSVYYDVWALLGTDGLVALVRAVEAKHGIKESP